MNYQKYIDKVVNRMYAHYGSEPPFAKTKKELYCSDCGYIYFKYNSDPTTGKRCMCSGFPQDGSYPQRADV